jgi:hypothetical protein
VYVASYVCSRSFTSPSARMSILPNCAISSFTAQTNARAGQAPGRACLAERWVRAEPAKEVDQVGCFAALLLGESSGNKAVNLVVRGRRTRDVTFDPSQTGLLDTTLI